MKLKWGLQSNFWFCKEMGSQETWWGNEYRGTVTVGNKKQRRPNKKKKFQVVLKKRRVHDQRLVDCYETQTKFKSQFVDI